jgi:hypothetical protein
MTNLIAVNNPFTLLNIIGTDAALDTSCLKREALMFNQICIPTLSASFLSNNQLHERQPEVIEELQWLSEQGILFEPDKVVYDDGMLWDVEQFASTLIVMKFGGEGVPSLNTAEISRSVIVLTGIGTRMHAIKLHNKGVAEAYSVLNSLQAPPMNAGPERNILEMVINELPVPDDLTPWEQIIEFRRDPDSLNKFLKLKNWMNDIAKMQLKPNEVDDKLKSLISDYQAHLNIHKMKTKLDTIKTIILAEAGFITSGWLTGLGALPGLIGMVATPLYTIRQRQISLLEEEQKAPGKEIAYIIKAKDAF